MKHEELVCLYFISNTADRLTIQSMDIQSPCQIILTVVFHMTETLQEAIQQKVWILSVRHFRMHSDLQQQLGMTSLVMKLLCISVLF